MTERFWIIHRNASEVDWKINNNCSLIELFHPLFNMKQQTFSKSDSTWVDWWFFFETYFLAPRSQFLTKMRNKRNFKASNHHNFMFTLKSNLLTQFFYDSQDNQWVHFTSQIRFFNPFLQRFFSSFEQIDSWNFSRKKNSKNFNFPSAAFKL